MAFCHFVIFDLFRSKFRDVNDEWRWTKGKVELQHVCFCICSVSVSSKKLRLVYSSHLKGVKKTTIWKSDTLMPPISKSYMTKNDYYMKIGVIIETLMPPIFIYVTVLGHSLLSHPVAWRRSSSPIGLGYRRYASTHPLNALQMAALRAAIWTHLATEHQCLRGRRACAPLLNFL